jgi:hypothetical protein
MGSGPETGCGVVPRNNRSNAPSALSSVAPMGRPRGPAFTPLGASEDAPAKALRPVLVLRVRAEVLDVFEAPPTEPLLVFLFRVTVHSCFDETPPPSLSLVTVA